MADGQLLKVLKRSAFLVVKVQELEAAREFRHFIAKCAGTAKHVDIAYNAYYAANTMKKLTSVPAASYAERVGYARIARKSKLTTQMK